METISMQYHPVCWKKKIINLLSAELAKRVVTVEEDLVITDSSAELADNQ